MDVMRQGTITCECGNEYYFMSIRPEIICMKCGKMNPNNGETIEIEEPILEELPPEEGE